MPGLQMSTIASDHLTGGNAAQRPVAASQAAA